MKATKFNQQKCAYEQLHSLLKQFPNYNNLPQDIQSEVKKFKDYLKSYDIEKLNVVPSIKLEGEVLDAQNLLSIVEEASGYTKWKVSEYNADELKDELESSYGVELQTVRQFDISRPGRGTSRVLINCLPGHVQVMLDNGSVGWYIEHLIKNDELESELSVHME